MDGEDWRALFITQEDADIDQAKVAAYLYFDVDVDGTFTMRDIRDGLGSDAEHLNRRLRNLKKARLGLQVLQGPGRSGHG